MCDNQIPLIGAAHLYFDSNGVLLIENDVVYVDDPDDTDIHQHSFVGYVVGYKGEYVTVRDHDGDCFDLEPHKLTIGKEPG